MSNNRKTIIMNAETAASCLIAVETLHLLFGEGLPAFKDCNADNHREVLSRAYNAIEDTEKARNRSTVIAAKQAVDKVLDNARREFAVAATELLKLSPATRAAMGIKDPPDSIRVPVSELAEAFPAGTLVPDMVRALHSMSYKLSPGKPKEGQCVVVSVKAQS
jgi:hypothetical protein